MLNPKSTKQHSKPKCLYIPVTKPFTNPSTGQNNKRPYKGTFTKTSNIIIGKRPFRNDNKIFDYDIDNGNNWNTNENGNTNEKYTEDSSTSRTIQMWMKKSFNLMILLFRMTTLTNKIHTYKRLI